MTSKKTAVAAPAPDHEAYRQRAHRLRKYWYDVDKDLKAAQHAYEHARQAYQALMTECPCDPTWRQAFEDPADGTWCTVCRKDT